MAAVCLTAGSSGVGTITGVADDVSAAGPVVGTEFEPAITGLAVCSFSTLASASRRFFSRFVGGASAGVPVMARFNESASSSKGLALRMAVQECSASSVCPSL